MTRLEVGNIGTDWSGEITVVDPKRDIRGGNP